MSDDNFDKSREDYKVDQIEEKRETSELELLGIIVRAFKVMTKDERSRSFTYLKSRFDLEDG